MNQEEFAKKLSEYKKLIDSEIEVYSKNTQKSTLVSYGENSKVVVDTFLDILSRGGKRIRGALVILGYEMCGGKDVELAVQVARIVEMVHAYILMIDDFQDRSATRRGGPTGHEMLAKVHEQKNWSGDGKHLGEALSVNAALFGNHAAQMNLSNIDAPEDVRIKLLSILNRTMLVTAHGQTNDIINEVSDEVSESDIENVMLWKTANYTILNPIHMGMVLAGADCHHTDGITEYAINIGKAFQITDDTLGVFGTEFESGKSPMDDIREGKRTLLTMHALKNADSADKNYLLSMLGNDKLSLDYFKRCKEIMIRTGALEFAKSKSVEYVNRGVESLKSQDNKWDKTCLEFLEQLANYLLSRTS